MGKNIWHRIATYINTVGVRPKILIMVLGLVLLLSTAITLQVRVVLERVMREQLESQGVTIAHDLAIRATDLILVNDLYNLKQLLLETTANNENIRYAFIVNAQGQVLAHTFHGGFPLELLSYNTVASDVPHHSVTLATEEGNIWDTAVPIYQGIGIARVGLSETGINLVKDTVTTQVLIITLLIVVVASTGVVYLTWTLTRPLLQLAKAADAVEKGDLTQRVPHWADDEIGELTDSFNEMVASLANAEATRQEQEKWRTSYVQGVITAQEDERKRISRELHDSTSQSLTSLMVGLKALGSLQNLQLMQEHAENLRGVASQTLQEVHNIALQLRPSVLDDLGLSAAIERYVNDCRQRYSFVIDLNMRGLLEERLPLSLETALYRIVQEAVTNIARHANASTASILLERKACKVVAIVEDDGVGMAVPLTNTERLGLYGIRERVELLGGNFTIESILQQGTTLFIELPIPKQS